MSSPELLRSRGLHIVYEVMPSAFLQTSAPNVHALTSLKMSAGTKNEFVASESTLKVLRVDGGREPLLLAAAYCETSSPAEYVCCRLHLQRAGPARTFLQSACP